MLVLLSIIQYYHYSKFLVVFYLTCLFVSENKFPVCMYPGTLWKFAFNLRGHGTKDICLFIVHLGTIMESWFFMSNARFEKNEDYWFTAYCSGKSTSISSV